MISHNCSLDAVWGLLFLIAAFGSLVGSIRTYRMTHSHHPSSSHPKNASRLNLYLPSSKLTLLLVTIFNLLSLALGIWSVESLLRRNQTNTTRGAESQWTFGQISAIILPVGPLFTFARLLRMRFFGVSANRGLSLDREGMPIKELGRGGHMDSEKQPR